MGYNAPNTVATKKQLQRSRRNGVGGSGQQDQEQGQAVKEVIAERRQCIKAAFRNLVVRRPQHRVAKRSKHTKAERAAEPSQPTKGKGKAVKSKPAPQPGRWVDRDCNAALNVKRIGESRWRPLELCWWPEQAALPAKGKEYPGLGYKRVRDKPPKSQQQQPAVTQ
ncbi:hypothetical protein QJQ45_001672 [Haematococcus lacustris]|nr:hypothetical protein QJQ45_001672 [Haematococcus lacustris]